MNKNPFSRNMLRVVIDKFGVELQFVRRYMVRVNFWLGMPA